jgi:hypothetical protein
MMALEHILILAAAALLVVMGCVAFLVILYSKRGGAHRQAASAMSQPNLAAPPGRLTHIGGLTLQEAEEMLDWLEQHHVDKKSMLCEAGGLFAVEFRTPAGSGQLATLAELKARSDRVILPDKPHH